MEDHLLRRLRTRLLLHTDGQTVMTDIIRKTVLEFPEIEHSEAISTFWWLVDSGYIEYDCSRPKSDYPKMALPEG